MKLFFWGSTSWLSVTEGLLKNQEVNKIFAFQEEKLRKNR